MQSKDKEKELVVNSDESKVASVNDMAITHDEIVKITKILEKINKKSSIQYTALKGFVTGIFQVTGATIGIAVVFFILSKFLQGVEKLPFINVISDSDLVKIVRQEVDQYGNKTNPEDDSSN